MAAKSMKERLEQRLAANTSAHNIKQEDLPDFLTTRKNTVSQVVTQSDAIPASTVRTALVDPNPWQPRTFFPDGVRDFRRFGYTEVLFPELN